jgi:hypothetical protein
MSLPFKMHGEGTLSFVEGAHKFEFELLPEHHCVRYGFYCIFNDNFSNLNLSPFLRSMDSWNYKVL